MKYDITKTPPSSDELTEQREKYTSIIDKVRLREKWVNGIAVTTILAGILMASCAVILMAFYIVYLDEPDSLSVVGVGVVFGAGIIALDIALDYVTKKIIIEPREHAKKELKNLLELDASNDPYKYIQLIVWCQEDDTQKAYQYEVAKMGRKLVIGEFLAAEQWSKSMELNKVKEQNHNRGK